MTARELKLKAIHLAKFLQKNFDVQPGDVLSICSENRFEVAITLNAAFFLAATVAPINHSYIQRKLNNFNF